MKFVSLDNARNEEQKQVMEKIIEDELCPFCEENLLRYHKRPILKTGKYWITTENQWPYEGTKEHLLAITRRHVETPFELTPEESAELFELFGEVFKERNMRGGTIAMRFNPPEGGYASTVRHLHAHLIQPDIENPEHQGVKFTVSKPVNPQK